MLISVIVPVYKAEKFLTRCVQGVLDQTYTNWELLLVDDGSPDKCSQLCDEWAKKDDRIKVFHKKNGGVSSARNVGLENMRGGFVTFVDSDDCLTPDCLQNCLDEIVRNDLDVLQFYFVEYFPDGRVLHHKRIETDICSADSFAKAGRLLGCACGGIYNARIIGKFNIRFEESLHYLEDAFFICEIVKHSNRLKRIPGEYYEYYKNPNGSDKPKDWDYYLDSIEYAARYKKNNPLFGVMIDGWCTMLAMRYVSLAPKHDFPRFNNAWKNLNICDEYINNVHRRDVVFFDRLQHAVGVRVASIITKNISRIFKIYEKIRDH